MKREGLVEQVDDLPSGPTEMKHLFHGDLNSDLKRRRNTQMRKPASQPTHGGILAAGVELNNYGEFVIFLFESWYDLDGLVAINENLFIY